jgi:hypothetical protein
LGHVLLCAAIFAPAAGQLLLTISHTFARCLITAFAFVLLWGWFVVPFFGLAPVPLANAAGLALIAELLLWKTASAPSSNDDDAPLDHAATAKRLKANVIEQRRAALARFAYPAALVCLGWVFSRLL